MRRRFRNPHMAASRWTRFRGWLGPDPRTDVEDELSFHLEMRVKELIQRGESPERARELAIRRFGDYDSSRTECVEIDERRSRRMERSEYFAELGRDFGYALRTLRRTPGFTAVAVASLGLGIGATSAIFSVVHGVLLQSLPYHAPDRLHEVRTLYPDGTGYSLSAADFMSVREHSRVFERVESYAIATSTLLGAGEPREVRGASVSDGLFDLLGLPTTLGRGFARDENQPGKRAVAVLEHGFWQREFGGDRTVLGRTLSIGGQPYSVIGVLAPGAQVPGDADMYTPLEYDSTFSATTAANRRGEFLRVLGRARAGMGVDPIDADLRRVGTILQTQFPSTNGGLTFDATSLRDLIVGEVRKPLLILFGAVGFVLLVACANVANLLLARVSSRHDELAVRAALGAGRGRLVRQLLTESMVLGIAGGVVGLLVAYWGTRALIAAQPADIPRLNEIGVNPVVVIFTLATAVVTGLCFGVLPAMQGTSGPLMGTLREGGRGAGVGRGTHRVRSGLVVAEMALAVMLLMGAGLLIRSFVELTRVDPGFRPERAMAFRVILQGDRYANGQQVRTQVAALLDRLRTLPGVTAVAATSTLPLNGRGSLVDFAVSDAPPPPNVNAEIGMASVTPDFVRAIGTTLVRGRGLTDGDVNGGPAVVLINEAGARLWFPDVDPIGKRPTAGGVEREIVGVVADILQRDPGQATLPQMYAPLAQRTTRALHVVVRSAGDPLALASAVRAEVSALDPNLPVPELVPLANLLTESMARPRFYTSLLTLFAGVALALAAIGIFGVLSYSVAQRSREISIRMALGASAAGVIRMIVRHAMTLAAIGVAIGMVGATALGRVLRSQLFGVSVLDPLTLGAVVVVLLASAAAASYLPARRAAGLDPATTLRDG
jgi:predicted permease